MYQPLLPDGVLISEQVAIARSLRDAAPSSCFCRSIIVGGDGTPARMLGRAIRD